jgi:hypothetical protein
MLALYFFGFLAVIAFIGIITTIIYDRMHKAEHKS